MRYIADFLTRPVADALFACLCDELCWSGERVQMFGRWHAVPRLVCWCGEPSIDYRYAGRAHRCDGWFEPLLPLRRRLREALEAPFNFALLNRYRDGTDAMGWHADDEACLGREPLIASISLGATRRLRVRVRRPKRPPSTAIDLQHGSLLLAWGNCQRDYQHCLARTRKAVGERINLTFRNVL
jgi:alkylated DNA repair dioxygenase AlkB